MVNSFQANSPVNYLYKGKEIIINFNNLNPSMMP